MFYVFEKKTGDGVAIIQYVVTYQE